MSKLAQLDARADGIALTDWGLSMDRQRTTPTWPFLCILACLFVLSLGAPKGWERVARERPVGNLLQAPRARVVFVPDVPEVLTPADGKPGQLATSPGPTPAPTAPAIARLPAVETPAPLVAGPMLDPALVASRSTRPTWSSAARLRRAVIVDPALEPNPVAEANRLEAALGRPRWQQPTSLVRMLDRLAHDPQLGSWALRTLSLIHELGQEIDSPAERGAAIAELQMALGEADCFAAELGQTPVGSHLRRARHALARRLAVWDSIDRLAEAPQLAEERPSDRHRLALAVAGVEAETAGSDAGAGWREYLLLENLRQLAEDRVSDREMQRQLAQRVLTRLERSGLSAGQRNFMQQQALASLAAELRPLAVGPLDQGALLAGLERYESTGLTSDAVSIAQLARRLSWSDDPEAQALAGHFESNYRNANFRVAISRELIERLVPSQPVVEAQVRDTILGMPVRGRSTIWSQTHVRLTPDEHRLRIALEASGLISARTRVTKGPATVYSNSQSLYTVRQELRIGPGGLEVGPPQASVNTNMRLRDIDTNFDGIPLLGAVAQNVARSQQQQVTGAARRESEYKIARQAAARIDQEGARRMQEAVARFEREVCEPLVALGLDPQFIQLKTTDQRLVARVRLAGDDQLGGHTPRPEAPSDSLASVQVHESAANNLIERLGLDGQTMSLAQAYTSIRAKLGRPGRPAPPEMRDDVLVRFAASDAVHVRCQDGLLKLTLAIAEMTAEGHRWRDFTVYVTYRPSFNNDRAELVREGIVQLAGPRLSTKSQVALRGVFSKVFPRDHAIPLVPKRLSEDPRLAGLTLTQFVVNDGWIGLALGPRRPVPQSAVVQQH